MLSLFLAVLMSKFEESRDAQARLEDAKKEQLKVEKRVSGQENKPFLGSMGNYISGFCGRLSRSLGAPEPLDEAAGVVPGDSSSDSGKAKGVDAIAKDARRWPYSYACGIFSMSNP